MPPQFEQPPRERLDPTPPICRGRRPRNGAERLSSKRDSCRLLHHALRFGGGGDGSPEACSQQKKANTPPRAPPCTRRPRGQSHPSPGRGPGELGGQGPNEMRFDRSSRASCKPPRLPQPRSARQAARAAENRWRARPCKIPGLGSRAALRACLSRSSRGRRAPPQPPGPSAERLPARQKPVHSPHSF